jgi:hypothetical protein
MISVMATLFFIFRRTVLFTLTQFYASCPFHAGEERVAGMAVQDFCPAHGEAKGAVSDFNQGSGIRKDPEG